MIEVHQVLEVSYLVVDPLLSDLRLLEELLEIILLHDAVDAGRDVERLRDLMNQGVSLELKEEQIRVAVLRENLDSFWPMPVALQQDMLEIFLWNEDALVDWSVSILVLLLDRYFVRVKGKDRSNSLVDLLENAGLVDE